jgi:hypothetical protein
MVSLLLCLATAAMWVRSHWFYDSFGGEWSSVHRFRRGGFLNSSQGRMQVGWWVCSEHDSTAAEFGHYSFEGANDLMPGHELMGFAYAHPVQTVQADDAGNPMPWYSETHTLMAPYAFVLLVTGALPTISMVQRRTHRQWRGRNCCLSCSYDLRATPDRCPECGTIPQTAQAPPASASSSSAPPTFS